VFRDLSALRFSRLKACTAKEDYLADARALGLWKSARYLFSVRMFSEVVRKLSVCGGKYGNVNCLRKLSRFAATPDLEAVTTQMGRGFSGPEVESLTRHHSILYDIYCLML
jgi:hypothetical protein